MKNPNNKKGGATPEELREYAFSRANEQAELVEQLQKMDCEKREQDEDYREPLAISHTVELKIELSWGGDADGYKIYLDSDGNAESGVYYWADWGVYEEVPLTEEQLANVVDVYLAGEPSVFID